MGGRSVRRDGAVALLVAFSGAVAACGGGSSDATVVERSDSAGVEVVMNRGADVPLPFRFEPVLTLGGQAEGPESFFEVGEQSVATDGRGHIYVLDRGNHRVLMFDSTGEHVRTMGRKGGGPGELPMWPTRMEIGPDGTVYVYDIGKQGFVRYAADGSVLADEPLDVYLPDGSFAPVQGGMLVKTMRRQGAGGPGLEQLILLRDGRDSVVLAERAIPELKPVQYDCVAFSGVAPLFSGSLVWAVSGERLYAATGDDYRIDVREGDSLVASLRRDVTPRSVDREMALRQVGDAQEVQFGDGRTCRIPPEQVVEEQGFAAVLPAIDGLAVGPDGRVWVRRGHVRDEKARIDLFGPDGAYLGTLPPEAPFPAAFLPDGRIAAVERDELDVPRVVVYQPVHSEGRSAMLRPHEREDLERSS